MTLALDTLQTLALTYLAWLVLICVLLLAALIGCYFLVRWGWRRLHSRQVACYNGLIPETPQEETAP